MNMTPEHVALFGYAMALIGAPTMAAMLAFCARDELSKANRQRQGYQANGVASLALAAMLMLLWAPLALIAPAVIPGLV